MPPRTLRLPLRLLVVLATVLPAWGEWRSLRTDSFLLFYPAAEEALAVETLAAFDGARPRVEALTGGSFRRLPVVIQDLGAYSNGLADPAYRRIELYPYEPAPTSEIGFSEDWIRSLAIHELTHIGQLNAVSGAPAVVRAIVGPVLSAGIVSPAWLAEGLAVYAESSSSPYEGRLNDGTFDTLVGLQAHDGVLPSLGKATFSEEAYPFGGGSYLYGASFVSYLAERGGEEALAALLAGQAGSLLTYLSPPFPLIGLDRAATRSFGARMPELWRDWQSREAEPERAPVQEKPIGSAGAAAISCAARAGGDLYYARLDRRKTGVESYQAASIIVRLGADGSERTLLRTPSSLSCGFAVNGSRLYYALMEYEGGHVNIPFSGRGMTSVLRLRDLDTGSDRELFRAPLRCFTVLGDGTVLYAVDSEAGDGSAIWEYLPGERSPRLLRRLGLRVFEMASEGTTLVLCAREKGRNSDLYRMATGNMDEGEPEPIVRGPWSEKSISLEGGILRFSTNPDGEHQAWGMDLRDGSSWRYETGAYAAWPSEDAATGTLSYVGLTSSGPRIMQVASRRLEATPGAVTEEEPPSTTAPEAVLPAGARKLGYWPNLLTLVPRVRLPFLTTDLESVELGVLLSGESAIGDIGYEVRARYDTGSALASVVADLSILFAAPLDLELSYSSAAAHRLAGTLELKPFAGLQSGVSSVGLGLTATAGGVFSRLELEPFVSLGFRAPWLRGSLGASLWLDRVELGFGKNVIGVDGTAWLRVTPLGGELTVLAEVGWEPSGLTVLVPPVLGHTGVPEGSPAGFARLAYEHILLKIRSGLWNPAFYLGDLVGGVFVEVAASATEQDLAAGVEATMEMRFFALSTGLSVTLEGWLGVDEDLRFIYGYAVSGDVPILSGRGRSTRLEGAEPAIYRGKVDR